MISAYRVAGYLALLAAAAFVVAFGLGHPLGSLAVQMGGGR